MVSLAANAVSRFAALNAATKARRLFTAINSGFCSFAPDEVEKNITYTSNFLGTVITGATLPHHAFEMIQPRQESIVGYCFGIIQPEGFRGITPQIQR